MLNLSKNVIEDLTTINYKDETTVEASLNLSPERENKIVSVSGMIAGDKISVEGDVVNYSGKVLFNVIFEGEELERVETGVKFEFKKTEEGAKHAVCLYELSDFKARKENGALYVSCELGKNLIVYKERKTEIADGADCLLKKEEIDVAEKLFGSQKCDLDDKFETQKIKKVLQSSVCATVEKTSCFDNVVTVEGFVITSFVFLPFSENSDIVKETRSLPYKFEISLDGVNQTYTATGFASVDDFSVKAYQSDESAQTQIETAVTLDVTVVAEGCKKVSVITDAVSGECDLIFTEQRIVCEKTSGYRSVSQRISGKCAVTVPEYSRFIKAVGETATITQYEIGDGEVTFVGTVEADCIFYGDNGIVSHRSVLPFTVTELCRAEKIEYVSVSAENLQGRMRSGGLEQDVTVSIRFSEVSFTEVKVLGSIEEGEKSDDVCAPITVYTGKKGDDEWDAVKALKEDIKVIYEYNPELSFPLKEDERIVVLRKPVR